MSLDGAVIEGFTSGINAPDNGQQGYVAFADAQVPYPNLEYLSKLEAGAALRVPIAQAANVKSAAGATVNNGGTGQISHTFGIGIKYGVREFLCRAIARIGTTLQYAGRLRVVIITNASGTLVNTAEASEYTVGSGFSMTISTAPGSTAFTFNLTNSSGSTASYFTSITETYNEQIV
jgi:hypothetical protein